MSKDTIQSVRVASIEAVARDVRLFRLAPLVPAQLTPAEAGAHIDVHLPHDRVRQYSLVVGIDSQHYVIAVKKDSAGRGGSLSMHGDVQVGQTLTIGAPRNLFPLVESSSISVLIAGGIGITPIWSMVLQRERLGLPFRLYYACRTQADVVFAEAIAQRSCAHLHLDEEEGRVLDVAAICADTPEDAHLYCCGPTPMLSAFKAATRARPSSCVHFEDFGSPPGPLSHPGFELHLARSGRSIVVEPGQRIVDAMRMAGESVTVSCEQGICGACESTVLEGEPEHGCKVLSADEREAGNTMMICCGGSRSAKLVLDL